ncbi:MAG: DUF1592 domain-containing protein, partial [Myxococcales bacterium]|nr:DUF1592 domain-containing protein [Myxococcales bacterium]
LNRLEYDNTVRDLLGTRLRPAQSFPPDGEAEGFDNIAAALKLSPTLLDRYFAAARAVVDEALDERPAYAFRYAGADMVTAGGYPVGDLWALQGNAAQVTVEVVAGTATARIRLGASQIGAAPAPLLRFSLDGQEVETLAVPGSAAALVEVVHALSLGEGVHVLRYEPTNHVNMPVENDSNDVLVHSLVVEADERIDGPGRGLVFVCEPGTDEGTMGGDCAKTIVQRFARRAYRRPLRDGELDGLMELHDALRADGETQEQAIRLVMRSILISPKFLYRGRTLDDADGDAWLDPHVLASRLSYFLWSSMPDDELFEAAASGELTTDSGLEAQVRRMLADDKARALRDGFAEQYLATRRLQTQSPSPEIYPGFDDALRASMIEESKAFFGDFVSSNVPVTEMLRPSFAFRDARLAAHYGEVPPPGPGMTRVSVGPKDRRGLLALSAWLTAQSDAEHSSPIKRGRFVSDNLLCEPVPPPPPGLAVEPIVLGDDTTIRDSLEQHRGDPACATCHALLDVLGMGFERFDGVGREREGDVDSVGELPDGTTFEGAEELASAIGDAVFVRCLTKKLFTYATGRRVVDADEDLLASLGDEATASDASLAELILAIVKTPAFRAPAPLDEEANP